jgi:diacylglycerol O-acyltransferase / wax synthase
MRLDPLDAVWLMLESPDTPMHVGTLAIFAKPRGASADYLRDLVQEMREHDDIASPWNLRLASSEGSRFSPRLVEEHDFDLDFHFRHSALPQPGGERELGVVVSRLHSQALDPGRPLWELHLIEGLEKNRFAMYFKAHHALIDNVNAVPLFTASLAARASQRNVPPVWTREVNLSEEGSSFDVSGLLDSLNDLPQAVSSMGRVASSMLDNLFRRQGQGSFFSQRGAPRSTLNRRINSQRRVATQQFEQKRIERLAKLGDTNLNTILAYICGSSARRFFKEYNVLPEEPLIAALPVSLQERSDLLPGNAITGLRVSLATHIGDPLDRLEALKHSIAEVREDRASLPATAARSYIMMRTAPIYATQLPGVGQFVPPVFNLTVSNTPSFNTHRFYNGAKLEAIYPLNPLLQYSALSVDCVTYGGKINIGFTGARDTLPHLQRLAVYSGLAVDELESALKPARRRA